MSAPHPWYRQAPGEPPPLGARVDDARAYRVPTMAERFLGGPPIAVIARLVVVSLLVGALLMWLDIRPFEVLRFVRATFDRLWDLGWDSIRAVGQYLVAGALIVVPCWFVLRLINYRR